MKLGDVNLQVYKKKTLANPASCILPSFFETHQDYFFQGGFESVREKFLSVNISEKVCYL